MAFNVPRVKRSATKPYEFPSTDPAKPIILHTRPLTLDTREVFNAAFAADAAPAEAPKDKYDQRMAARADNLKKLATCCIERWEGVMEDGAEVALTPAKALELLQFLDGEGGYREEITSYIAWAANPYTFREPLTDGTELGKG